MKEVVVTFRDVPDGLAGRSAGWLCWIGIGAYVDGAPIGRGETPAEAFGFKLNRISVEAIERVFESCSNEVAG